VLDIEPYDTYLVNSSHRRLPIDLPVFGWGD
jgi:hypothetical protein